MVVLGLYTVDTPNFQGEVIYHFYRDKYDMDEEESWGPIEGVSVYDAYCPFLDHSDLELYIWVIFIGSG